MKHSGVIRNVAGVFLGGKNTIVDGLLARRTDLYRSISDTTRPLREYEIPGVHYNPITPEEFEAGVQNGRYLEHAGIWGGNRYGTPVSMLEAAQAENKILITQCDVQGLEQLLENCEDVCSVFLNIGRPEQRRRFAGRPGSAETLKERLVGSDRERTHFNRLVRQYPGRLWRVENTGDVHDALNVVGDFLFN